MNQLMVINIPQLVKKRVFEVDIKKLQQILRASKKAKGLTNAYLSEQLGIPKTQVEHYFRTDRYFDIPDSEIWVKLSRLLDIEDDDLSKQITTFEIQEGLFEKSERHYFEDGLAPTILGGLNDKIIASQLKQIMKVIVIAIMDGTFESTNRIYSIDGLAPTLPTGCGGGHTPKILEISKKE